MLVQAYKSIPKTVRTLLFALLLALVFRSIVSAPYKIPTGSMIPTLKIGDFIFVNKLAYDLKVPFTDKKKIFTYASPKKGEVVVFIFPNEPDKDYIKRVVGVAGDKIDIQNGQLWINDQPIAKRPLADKSIIEGDMMSYEVDASTLSIENLLGVQHVIREIPARNEDENGICPEYTTLANGDHGCLAAQERRSFTVRPGFIFVMGDNRNDSFDSRYWGEVPLENVRGRALFVWLSFNPLNSYFKLGGIDFGPPRIERFGMRIL